MTHDTAGQFWQTYLGAVSDGNAKMDLFNPLTHFRAQAHAGEFDSLTDRKYFEKEKEAEDLSAFWDYRHSETVGNILLNAIAKTDLSASDIRSIGGILADASVRTSYCAADPEESQECDEEDLFNPDLDFSPVDGPTPFDSRPEDWTPKDFYEYLSRNIHGQEAAKRAVSMLVYNHLHGRSRNIVMLGSSGTGKTETWRVLSKILNCVRIINGPQLSGDGWKGSLKIRDIFTDEPKQIREHMILVIDEADKMCEAAFSSGGNDVSKIIQNELLKLMDGDTLTFVNESSRKEKTVVDCSGISVVMCGSFESMVQAKSESSGGIGFGKQTMEEIAVGEFTYEDLVKYANIRREIAGRINQIVKLDTLYAGDFEAIMDGPASPIKKLEKSHHVFLSVNKNTRRRLASDAAQSGLGCRYIRSKLQSLLDEQMFDNPDSEEYELYYE